MRGQVSTTLSSKMLGDRRCWVKNTSVFLVSHKDCQREEKQEKTPTSHENVKSQQEQWQSSYLPARMPKACGCPRSTSTAKLSPHTAISLIDAAPAETAQTSTIPDG